MVCRDAVPIIAIPGHLFREVPSSDICTDAGVRNVCGCNAELRQFGHMDGVHTAHAIVTCAICILGHGRGSEIAFDFQDCPQDVVIDFVILSSRNNTGFNCAGEHWGRGRLLRECICGHNANCHDESFAYHASFPIEALIAPDWFALLVPLSKPFGHKKSHQYADGL